MQLRPRLPFNRHRLARLLLWAQAMLAWVAVLFEGRSSDARRARQRRAFADFGWAVSALQTLAVVRALELAGVAGGRGRPRSGAKLRQCAGPGFRRRLARATLRQCAGSRVRRALRHRDPRVLLARLRCAFADLDGFARRHLAARMLRGLTRVAPVVIAAPPAQAIPAFAAPAPVAADSS
ncbi:MAG: hypothetical protein AB7Q23_11505 [Hyphomonadaceae bacterium]